MDMTLSEFFMLFGKMLFMIAFTIGTVAITVWHFQLRHIKSEDGRKFSNEKLVERLELSKPVFRYMVAMWVIFVLIILINML